MTSDPRYKATLVRRVSDEESIQIETRGDDRAKIEEDAEAFLSLMRRARIAHNEEVVAVFQKKSLELDAEIENKGNRVRQLDAELAEKGHRAEKRRGVNGQAGAY